MPKRPVQTPITDKEIALAHLVMAGTMTDRRAAEAVGIDPSRAAYVKTKPRVQAHGLAPRIRGGWPGAARGRRSFSIQYRPRTDLAKWWEFANIDPTLGYNTNSQGKALESLWNALGFEASRRPSDEDSSDTEPVVYQPPWLLDAVR